MNNQHSSHFKSEFFAAMTTLVLALPSSLAYGMLAFSPLGIEYVPLGIMSGLVAFVCGNAGAFLKGGVRSMSNGPIPLSALMLSAVILHLQALMNAQEVDFSASDIVALLFCVVLLCGVFQFVFGLIRFGAVAKYIPYSVLSGLLNGTAVFILLSQVPTALGLDTVANTSILDFEHWRPIDAIIAIVTIVSAVYGKHIVKQLPGYFVALIVGAIAYYLALRFGVDDKVGATVGVVPVLSTESFELFRFVTLMANLEFGMLIELALMAVSVSLVLSLHTMISGVTIDGVTHERSDTNAELMNQGLANMCCACFGGIAVAGNAARTIATYNAHGKTQWTRFSSAFMGLLLILFCSPLIGMLPLPVLAAILVVFGWKAFDTWSVSLIKRCFSHPEERRVLVPDLAVVGIVLVSFLSLGVFIAVMIGVFISIVLFIYRLSRSSVRRNYTAERVRSNVERALSEILWLEENGGRIKILELQGALFFGSSEYVADLVDDQLKNNPCYIIIDVSRVSDIDSTGVKVLSQVANRARKRNAIIMFSGFTQSPKCYKLLATMGFFKHITKNEQFNTIEEALACAEDEILAEEFGADRYDQIKDIYELEIVKQLSQEDAEIFRSRCEQIDFADTEKLFSQGDAGDCLYFLLRGRVDIYTQPWGQTNKTKIASLCPGTMIGEMAVLDGKPRGGDAIAKNNVTCLKLDKQAIGIMGIEYPAIAVVLMKTVGQELAKRMRIANRLSTELRN